MLKSVIPCWFFFPLIFADAEVAWTKDDSVSRAGQPEAEKLDKLSVASSSRKMGIEVQNQRGAWHPIPSFGASEGWHPRRNDKLEKQQ